MDCFVTLFLAMTHGRHRRTFLWKCAAGVPYSRCNFARKNIVNADTSSSFFSAAMGRAL
jgi:hypothetical protein